MDCFVDIHCHILPGLDDGARDWQQAIQMARQAVEQGIRTVIATPHQSEQYPENRPDRIIGAVEEARRRFGEGGIQLEVLPGADVRIDERLAERVRASGVLTLGNLGQHILLELPSELGLDIRELVYKLEAGGVRSILSHPERHVCFQCDSRLLEELVAQGCLLQITAGSLLGQFGRPACRAAWRFVRQGLAHVVASDAHDPVRRPFVMGAAYEAVAWRVGAEAADALFRRHPAWVAQGRAFDPPMPQPRRDFLQTIRRAVRGVWRAAPLPG